MWRTEYRLEPPAVYDPPVPGSYSQDCSAVSYRFGTYVSHDSIGFVGQCVDADYVARRPLPRCENYDEQRWHGASGAVACRRLRSSKHSHSFARRHHHDDSSCFRRRRHRRSRSSRRGRDASESAAVAAYRRHSRHSESEYSAEASLRSEQRSRHTRHHWSRRRYSSSSNSSRGRRSSTVSESINYIHFYVICFSLLGTSKSGELCFHFFCSCMFLVFYSGFPWVRLQGVSIKTPILSCIINISYWSLLK